jgi:hypothetical protein
MRVSILEPLSPDLNSWPFWVRVPKRSFNTIAGHRWDKNYRQEQTFPQKWFDFTSSSGQTSARCRFFVRTRVPGPADFVWVRVPKRLPWERCRNLLPASGRDSRRLPVLCSLIQIWVRVPKRSATRSPLRVRSTSFRRSCTSGADRSRSSLGTRTQTVPLGALPEFASCSREEQPVTTRSAFTHSFGYAYPNVSYRSSWYLTLCMCLPSMSSMH